MLVRTIELEGFMRHDGTSVELPSPGLVLITGPNGSGKSSLVEGVSVAAFGKTLRGTPPWSAKKGRARITTAGDPGLEIDRKYSGKRQRLGWRQLDQPADAVEYESSTKAQGGLEAHIGTWDVWRRTHVFSSSDASNFTMATDAQRKKLLEQLLGMGRFDPALAACRADRKDAQAKLGEAERLLAQLESQASSTEERVADARRVLKTVPEPLDVAEARAKCAELEAMAKAATDDISRARAGLRGLDRAGAEHQAAAKEARRRLQALAAALCDRCEQPIPQALRDDLTASAEQSDSQAVDAKKAAQIEAQGLEEQLEELTEEASHLQGKLREMRGRVEAEDGKRRQRDAAQAAVDRAEGAVEQLLERIAKGSGVVEEHRARLALLQAVEQVLGLKGVRGSVLARALVGIELAANAWLSRICGSPEPRSGPEEEGKAELADAYRLSLKPYSENKQGGISDSISLEVEGAGGGHGYKASSGGERRRIDVSLVLALADVAQAAHGRGDGTTLFCDEVFDALDAAGVERVSEVLGDMAKDRTVVVISHSPELQQALRPSMWLETNAGEVVQLL